MFKEVLAKNNKVRPFCVGPQREAFYWATAGRLFIGLKLEDFSLGQYERFLLEHSEKNFLFTY